MSVGLSSTWYRYQADRRKHEASQMVYAAGLDADADFLGLEYRQAAVKCVVARLLVEEDEDMVDYMMSHVM